jgi:hypothetical protein
LAGAWEQSFGPMSIAQPHVRLIGEVASPLSRSRRRNISALISRRYSDAVHDYRRAAEAGVMARTATTRSLRPGPVYPTRRFAWSSSLMAAAAAIAAAVLVLAATKPDTFLVQRTASIKAPAEKIFPLIDNLRENAKWLPYYKKDPAITGRFQRAGKRPPCAVLFRRQQGRRLRPRDHHRQRAAGKGDDATADVQAVCGQQRRRIHAGAKGRNTDVTWAMPGKLPYLAKIVQLLCDVDSMVGRDFETGLANLKAMVET